MRVLLAATLLSFTTIVSSNVLVPRDTATYPVANDPSLSIIYTYPGPYAGPDPASAEWVPVLQALEKDLTQIPYNIGQGPVNEFKQGNGDAGAYVALKAPKSGQAETFTAARAINVLKTLEGKVPKKASLTIVLTADKSKVVGIGCTSSANNPCVTGL